MKIGLGLSLSSSRKNSGISIPLSGIFMSNQSVSVDATVGEPVGYVYPIGGVAPYSYEVLDSPPNFQFDASEENRLNVLGDLSLLSPAEETVTLQITDSQGTIVQDSFTITLLSGSIGGAGDGTSTGGGDYDIDPITQVTQDGEKISGKTGGFASMIWDIGPFLPGYTYTFEWTAELSAMSKQGTLAALGIAVQDGNDFHLWAYKGDGVLPQANTTEHNSEIYGDFSQPKTFTIETGAANANATVEGTNYAQIEISGNGHTATFRTSNNGTDWTDVFTDVDAAPLLYPASGTKAGIGAYFAKNDKGPFSIAIKAWVEAPVVAYSNVVLQILMEGSNGQTTFTDDSVNARAITASGNAQVQSNRLELDGTGDNLELANATDWHTMMNGDFTIEIFGIQWDSLNNGDCMLSKYRYSQNQRVFRWNRSSSSTLQLTCSTNGTDEQIVIQNSWTPSGAHDICIERSGNTYRQYVDGVMIGKATSSLTYNVNSPTNLSIGSIRISETTKQDMDGRMHALRISKVARYDSDDGYVVPSLPLPTS